MLAASASSRSLKCKMCSTDEELIAEKMSRPSQLELLGYRLLTNNPFRYHPKPQYWATEVVAGHKLKGLERWKADIVFFDCLRVTHDDMRNAVCLFLDGEGHFPWQLSSRNSNRDTDDQRQKDWEKSDLAARAGFKVVRVAEVDMHYMLRMVQLAWLYSATPWGWVMVSSRWNTGAHLVLVLQVRSP